MRTVGDVQLMLGVDAPRLERVQLGEQLLGIEDDAVAHDAHGALQDTRWYLVKDKGLTLTGIDGMAGIGAALVSHDQIGTLGQNVDDLALTFVAPLSADDHHTLRLRSEHSRSSVDKQKRPRLGALEHPLLEARDLAARAPVLPRRAPLRRAAPAQPYRRAGARSSSCASCPS